MNKAKKLLSLFLAVLTLMSCIALSSASLAATSLAQVKSLAAYKSDDDEINLKWSAVEGAKGYQIYQYNTTKKVYIKVGVTSKTSFEADDLKSATSYKFKVRAYRKSGSSYSYGPYSSVLTATTKPDEVENLRVTAKTKTSLTLKWNKVARAEGYGVFVYDEAKGKYVRKAQVTAATAELKGLKSGTTYKIKVRAFIKVKGTYLCGEYSDVLTAKTSGAASKAASTSSDGERIGTDKATEIVLNHAKLTKSKVSNLRCHLDKENGIYVYEVEFEYKNYEYEYEVNALTGKIITVEKDIDD